MYIKTELTMHDLSSTYITRKVDEIANEAWICTYKALRVK